jgi:cytochrome b561
MNSIDPIRRARTRSWEFVVLVCAVGIAGLLCDAWPNAMQGHRIMLHAAFGVLLWVMAVAQFHQHARFAGIVGGTDFGRLCGRPSRMVYLVLYVVFGAAQAIRTAAPAILQPPENLRDFLAYGVIALMTIRALAALHSRTGRRWPSIKAFRPAALQMSPKSARGGAAVEPPSRRAPVQNPL